MTNVRHDRDFFKAYAQIPQILPQLYKKLKMTGDSDVAAELAINV
jgi:glutaredoxin-related protein